MLPERVDLCDQGITIATVVDDMRGPAETLVTTLLAVDAGSRVVLVHTALADEPRPFRSWLRSVA